MAQIALMQMGNSSDTDREKALKQIQDLLAKPITIKYEESPQPKVSVLSQKPSNPFPTRMVEPGSSYIEESYEDDFIEASRTSQSLAKMNQNKNGKRGTEDSIAEDIAEEIPDEVGSEKESEEIKESIMES